MADGKIPVDGRVSIAVTVSVGAAAGAPDPDALLRAADESLYEAKRTGRNRVVTAELSGGPANGR